MKNKKGVGATTQVRISIETVNIYRDLSKRTGLTLIAMMEMALKNEIPHLEKVAAIIES